MPDPRVVRCRRGLRSCAVCHRTGLVDRPVVWVAHSSEIDVSAVPSSMFTVPVMAPSISLVTHTGTAPDESGSGAPKKNTHGPVAPAVVQSAVAGALDPRLVRSSDDCRSPSPPALSIGPLVVHWPHGCFEFAQPETRSVRRPIDGTPEVVGDARPSGVEVGVVPPTVNSTVSGRDPRGRRRIDVAVGVAVGVGVGPPRFAVHSRDRSRAASMQSTLNSVTQSAHWTSSRTNRSCPARRRRRRACRSRYPARPAR